MKRSATSFRDAVFARRLGENGMAELTSTGDSLLNLNQLVRGGDPATLVDEIVQQENVNAIVDLFVLLFATRNARGGKGEKKISYIMLERLCRTYPETCGAVLPLFPHYGYWKDIFLLMEAHITSNNFLMQAAVDLVVEQLQKDVEEVEAYKQRLREACEESELVELKNKGPSISLLAKWLPREGTSLDKKTEIVSRIVEKMGLGSDADVSSWEFNGKAKYRKLVVELTSYLSLPEVLLSLKREDEINFHLLASKATLRLRKVLLNEGKHGEARSNEQKRIRLGERFRVHTAKKGLKGGQIYPHEIVRMILRGRISEAEEQVLDAQWKDLWRAIAAQAENGSGDAKFLPTRMVPMADVSGSMHGVPMEVSIALSIGLSEITHPEFRHMVLTFSSDPEWHKLNPEDTIVKKVRSLMKAEWGMSTNFEAAYDLILAAAKEARLDREDLPVLVVFSDMQFDVASGRATSLTTMHEQISRKFTAMGEELGWMDMEPTPIVYWNLRNTGGHPVDKGTEGAVLLAGFSPSLLKYILAGESLDETDVEEVLADGTTVTKKIKVTPEEILRKLLDDEVYDPVRQKLVESQEGLLSEFSPL